MDMAASLWQWQYEAADQCHTQGSNQDDNRAKELTA